MHSVARGTPLGGRLLWSLEAALLSKLSGQPREYITDTLEPVCGCIPYLLEPHVGKRLAERDSQGSSPEREMRGSHLPWGTEGTKACTSTPLEEKEHLPVHGSSSYGDLKRKTHKKH
ncbi:hypothetical protein TNCV_1923251 [Trichonephila clavipes]|nr:hypothetical protein TNCV_1923251 [Trichonephila clavipes]